METLPLVTIGIPVYNEEKYIAETLESAIKQAYSNVKIIISDNCSTDGTVSQIESVLAKYPTANVEVVRQKKNLGPLGNFKFLFDQCKSDYFCWLGGHDVVLPSYIQSAVEALEGNPKVILAYPKSKFIDDKGEEFTEESSDSEISTLGLIPSARARKLLTNLARCTAIHGVFRITSLKNLPFKKVYGPDNLQLFYMTLKGEFTGLQELTYLRREPRIQEDWEARKLRYAAFGFYNESSKVHYATELIWLHFYYTVFSGIALKEKLITLSVIKEVMMKRSGHNYKDFIKLFLYQKLKLA